MMLETILLAVAGGVAEALLPGLLARIGLSALLTTAIENAAPGVLHEIEALAKTVLDHAQGDDLAKIEKLITDAIHGKLPPLPSHRPTQREMNEWMDRVSRPNSIG
jgi:hypothetical protein